MKRFLLALAGVLLIAPGLALAQERELPLKIVATIAQIGDAVAHIAGDRAEVKILMGEGVDPHLYRQTRSDVVALGAADIVFYNGLYLEAQMEDLLVELGQRKPVIALGETLPREKLIAHFSYTDKFDPHVWMDPRLWRGTVVAARDALIEFDPDGAATYTANAEPYLAELDRLAEYADEVLTTVAPNNRVLVSAHDAFGYFGRAYGFEVVGIQGLSTESEAGLQEIDKIVTLVTSRKIASVFVESSVSDRNVRAIVEGAAARGHTVKVGGTLYSDAMGAPGTYQGTYVGMIDHNVTAITRALGGAAPEAGMNGQLEAGL
jgi:manganese/zinc/iron transport system substrate-binding protein